MDRQIYSWFISYVSSYIGIEQHEAARLVDQILSWRDSYGFDYKDVLCSYDPYILLPLAHALVDSWKGDDCLIGFVDIADSYGDSSLEPLSTLLKDGLAGQYKSLLTSKWSRAKAVEREYDARWLAVQAIAVLLERIKKGTIYNQGHYYWKAKSSAEEILKGSLGAWRDEVNRYYGNGSAANRLRAIESTLREIVQYL